MKAVQFALALVFLLPLIAEGQTSPAAAPGVVAAAEVQRLMPSSVFFQGQTATTQLRNSFAVRFANGGLVVAGLVDTGGYSTSIRNKYQFYLLVDRPIEAGGKRIAPGAYGCGFLPDAGMLVMDLGGNELLRATVTHDAGLTRPRPLQMVAGKVPEEYRLYLGQDFVTIKSAR